METNTNVRNAIVEILVENYGKSFTYAQLAKLLGDKLASRRLAYKVLTELVKTSHVLRVSKTSKAGKQIAAWMVNDSDETHAVQLWAKYLNDAE